MRYVSLTLILIAAVLCFVAGYQVGKQSQPSVPAGEGTAEGAPVQTLSDSANLPQIAADQSPQGEPETTVNPFTLREKETIQTFFDQNERKLVGEILEVKVDSLKVRRQADGAELNVPVNMLSEEDQAFAAYLWEQQPQTATSPTPTPTPSQSGKSMEDKIWDELFR